MFKGTAPDAAVWYNTGQLMLQTYKKPILLALIGTIAPLFLGFMATVLLQRPQCPEHFTQAQINSAGCIIGADMSVLWILLAIPVVIVCTATALVWAVIIRHRRR